MIFQGLFRILETYFSGFDALYLNIDKYFIDKIRHTLGNNQNIENNLEKALEEIKLIIINEFVELGLYRAKVQNKFFDKFLTLKIEEKGYISSIYNLYEKKIAPLVYEVILEQIIFYLVDDRGIPIILYFKNKDLLPLEFIIELRNLKNILEDSPEKLEKLRKYIRIRDKIIKKFCENKEKIESLENLEDLKVKVQLFYLLYKIIDFFNIQYFFNFSKIKDFLKEHLENCMEHVPLISLKNPDLCYCALYLVKELNINFNHDKIKKFLLNSYKDLLDDFEVPILEATYQMYFYLQSTALVKLLLTDEQIKNIVAFDSNVLDTNYLENMETPQLANILAIFAFLDSLNNKNNKKIEAIFGEIEKRVTPNGVMQNRNDFYTSEACYYVIFSNYINNNLEKLNFLSNGSLLDNVVSKIYRNLKFLEFSGDLNIDLLSELFYSIESLRLLNCIKLKEVTLLLARSLFPKEIELKLIGRKDKNISKIRDKYLTVNKITGESNYIFTS